MLFLTYIVLVEMCDETTFRLPSRRGKRVLGGAKSQAVLLSSIQGELALLLAQKVLERDFAGSVTC